MNIEDLRLAKDMKYEALYWSLGYEELEKNIFVKKYDNFSIQIDSEKQIIDFNKISIVNGDKFILNSHKSFVILECINKLLSMGYSNNEIIIDLDNEYDIFCKDLHIKCFAWDDDMAKVESPVDSCFISINYKSRLISGVIERKTLIKTSDNKMYSLGIFENDYKLENYNLYNSTNINSDSFIIENGVAMKYIGNDQIVVVPEGVTELAPCLFWDNQQIEEVILPKTLINISGDTFYNSHNLKKITIPSNVKYMGNNPFAGCPEVKIINESAFFNMRDGVLYNKDFSRLIYYPISKKDESYKIIEGCKIVGKHAFYLCDNLKEISIPSSIIKLENNPFSGCTKLKLKNESEFYHICDDVIYDRDYSSIIGCLNSINNDVLILKDVKRICRNSFWNCKGIKKIVLPKSLEQIGYNPFVGCSNIEFISNTNKFIVYNGVLYNQDKTKLICYPASKAIGDVYLPEEVKTLERGAFSGCDKMENINLHNVTIISKTCFTNCNSLKEVYCSDMVSYVGEWAFAHCNNLKSISVYKSCYLDNNVILNSPTQIIKRDEFSNYVIESDNLYTLSSMLNAYKNKIKSILIDPPYNSNIDYIGYNDKYENNSYYQFMKKRIDIAYNLLTQDGFLVINIDEGEVNNLKQLCEEFFFKVKVCKWEKLHPFFDKNRKVHPNKKIVKYEYIIICFKSKKSKLNNIKQPYLEDDNLKEFDSKIPKIFSCFGTNSSAKDEIELIFGRRDYFQTPKPIKLIKELVRATSDKDSIILDFFAGSGTTGHAVIDLNREDNGKRKYVLISNNESDICRKVTLQRMKIYDDEFHFIC